MAVPRWAGRAAPPWAPSSRRPAGPSSAWAAPKFSTLQVYPDGAAAATGDFGVSFEPEVDLPGVARAAGAYGVTVASPDELPQVLKDALAIVHGGRSAVVSVQLPPV